MSLLETITSPTRLKALPAEQLPLLAEEIRSFLVSEVSKTGGHLGPNLGVVELTIALHRVFDSPRDAIVFDTGHQAYVHKLLTGRQDFGQLKKRGGLSGYPSRAESRHDVVENSHASTSLSWAEGIAQGHGVLQRRERDRHTVAVIGDGALTGGMAWEAFEQHRRQHRTLPLVIVVNDNERSYAPTIGGLAAHLSTTAYDAQLRADAGLGEVARCDRTPVVGGRRCTRRCTASRRASRTSSPRSRGCFEDLGHQNTSARSTVTTSRPSRSALRQRQGLRRTLSSCM